MFTLLKKAVKWCCTERAKFYDDSRHSDMLHIK